MKEADHYHRSVRWCDQDNLYIGHCPDLYLGEVCHGASEEEVYSNLCEIVRDEIAHRLSRGEALPEPATRVMLELELAA